jgi:hypothetical protein
LRGFVVLAGCGASCGWLGRRGPKETTDGHVSKFIALLRLKGWVERRETVGVVWVLRADVFGTRQEWREWRHSRCSDQSGDKISIELESLILAQNERWRQA